MKVLLVDDNPDITELLSKFLKAKGYEIIVTNDPLDGLAKIKNDQYDIVFLDIQMPGISGLDIIQELEIENILREQNIIIFSANNFTESEIDNLLKKDGIIACLEKPIQLSEILTVMVR
ncbi:MAG: response regulator [Nitrosopumilus sp.]|nr:response regulator [Nitrosopumilus sp.]